MSKLTYTLQVMNLTRGDRWFAAWQAMQYFVNWLQIEF